jgi:hypothetical protein
MRKTGIVVSGLVIALSCLCMLVSYAQSVPTLINYQGRLMDKSTGQPVDGSREIRFLIYPGDTASTPLWGETQNVTVTSGIYNVLLGSGNSLDPSVFSGPDRWMEVVVAGETLTPRQRIASVPYAMAFDLNAFYANKDRDGDGHDSVALGGDDCNDGDPTVYYGATEIPLDGIDQSCDGAPFGPYDTCSLLVKCGFEDGTLESCMSDIISDLAMDSTPMNNLATCMEGSTCGGLPACMSTLETDLKDELCTYLDGCGYKTYAECSTGLDDNWDGWIELLLSANACLEEGATCSASVIDKCMAIETFEYEERLETFGGNTFYRMLPYVTILFSDTTQTYSYVTPKGQTFPLTYDEEWEWTNYNLSYDNYGLLAYTWPSGRYTLLRNGSTLEEFNVPPYDTSMFPRQIVAPDPLPGSSVSSNPLTISWQFNEGAEPAMIEMYMNNWTHPGSTWADEMPGSVTSATIEIPSGTLNGDTLSATIMSYTTEYSFSEPLSEYFIRDFGYGLGPFYVWDGSTQ